jgi:O-antigen/teichoic acid export membrane protein
MTDAPQRSLGAGASLATLAQFINALTGGLTGIVVARILGPDGTGAFNVLFSAVLLITAFSTLGIETGISYHVSGDRWRPGEALRQAQLAALGLGVLGSLIGAAIALLTAGTGFRDISFADSAIALAAVPVSLSWTFASMLSLALSRYGVYTLAISAQGLSLLLLVAVLTPLFGLTGAVLALFAANAISALYLLVWGFRALAPAATGWLARTGKELRRASAFGVKAYLTNAMQYLNQRADLFILNASAAGSTVGHYAIALSITTLGLLLPRALSSVVLPRVAAMDASPDDHVNREVVRKSARHAVILVLAASLALAIGVQAIPLVYGDDFRPAVELTYILLPGVAAFGVANVLAAIVVGKGKPEYSLYTTLLVTPPTIVLYLVLVPTLGATGAALASTVSYSATFGLILFYFRRVTEEWSFRGLLPGGDELADYRRLAARAIRRRSAKRYSGS